MIQPPPEPSTRITYDSSDLALFAKARNWKTYWSGRLRSYIKGQVIEVGAGLGTSTEYMCKQEYPEWICLDPDPSHASHLAQRIASQELPPFCKVKCCVLKDLAVDVMVDTILYIDVLEHIENDEAEMRVAASHLKRGGQVVVLSPAFNCLYSPFDKTVGHRRRYSTKDIKRLTVKNLVVQKWFFLDSIGFFASLCNRTLLKSPMPSSAQIAIWDRVMVPVSRYADGVFGAVFGKTIVIVWEKV